MKIQRSVTDTLLITQERIGSNKLRTKEWGYADKEVLSMRTYNRGNNIGKVYAGGLK